MNVDPFIVSALIEYYNAKEADKSRLYEETMSVLRASGSARSLEGK